MAALKHIHVLSRTGEDDILLGWATRDTDTDGLYKWGATGWILIYNLPGTDLIYDSVTWRERLYWVDGKNALGIYDGLGFCTPVPEAPIGQYIRVHQDRLCIGGDARTRTEIEGASLVWPADSNRIRVIYCEVLDDATWSPNNFIDCSTVNGEIISGLEVGGVTTSTEGAQSTLAIFKPSVTMLHRGPLGTANVQLDIVSTEHGCPGYHSLGRSNNGIVFASKYSVCRLDPGAVAEPEEIGFGIAPDVKAIPLVMQKWTAGFYFDNKYHLGFSSGSATVNNREYELDMRDAVFPQEQNWYGPHTGDEILQYAVYNDHLVAAQFGTLKMWSIDLENRFDSMTSLSPRVAVIKMPRIATPNITEEKVDAIGLRVQTDASTELEFDIDYDRGQSSSNYTWTAPSTIGVLGAGFPVVRPLKQPAHDMQVTLTHRNNADLQIDSIYLRSRVRRRQAEKQIDSTQE